MNTKRELLEEHLRAWLLCKGYKEKRGEMIQNISSLLRIHPKSVGRAFRSIQLASHREIEQRGRSVYYSADVQAALYDVWDTIEVNPIHERTLLEISATL